MKWAIANFECLFDRLRNGMNVRQSSDRNGLPITRIETISNWTIDPERFGYAGLMPGDADEYLLHPGDILFSHINSESHLGKCAIYEGKPSALIHGMNLLCLRPRKGVVNPRFLFYALSGRAFRSQLPAIAKRAVNQASISIGNLRKLRFAVPPLREQSRIVELLEQADHLRRKRAEADALAQGILPALFRHWFGEPSTNPKGWPTWQLNGLVDFISGATPSKEKAEYWNGTIPWISPKDMKQPELSDSIDHVAESALRETNLRLIPANTALIVVRGMILAHTVPVCLARVPVTINQDMKGLSPRGEVTAEFLQWALLAQHGALLRLVTTAAHGTRKLDTDALGALQIPVPPPSRKDLMQKWTSVVREQQALARRRSSCGDAVDRVWRLLLHRAFTGELTAKWREAHMKELLAEMEHQARLLKLPVEQQVE